VGPAFAWTYADPSALTPDDPPIANSSVIPAGGLIVLVPARPKRPTTRSPGVAVVTEGARIDLLWGENAPLCESIGADWSRPLKSRTAPATAAGDASDHV